MQEPTSWVDWKQHRIRRWVSLPAPVTRATLPAREADARPRGPGMALYFSFFAGTGAAWEVVSARVRFPFFSPVVVGEWGRSKVSSVLAGAILKLCFEDLLRAEVVGFFAVVVIFCVDRPESETHNVDGEGLFSQARSKWTDNRTATVIYHPPRQLRHMHSTQTHSKSISPRWAFGHCWRKPVLLFGIK